MMKLSPKDSTFVPLKKEAFSLKMGFKPYKANCNQRSPRGRPKGGQKEPLINDM